MTEFAEDPRHRCRNPRCRSKLPSPVSNLREAFCTPGCHSSFYLKRCRVCEQPLEAKYRKIKNGGDRTKFVKVQNSSPTCGSTDCKRRWRQKDGTGRFSAPKQASGYQGSQESNLRKETPAAQALFSAINRPRWRQVAGPALTPNQLHCATPPGGGDRAALVDDCFTEPVWREVISPDGVRCWVTRGRLQSDGVPSDWKPCSPSVPVAEDLSIPDFLKREPTEQRCVSSGRAPGGC